jgi:hypothetical protein
MGDDAEDGGMKRKAKPKPSATYTVHVGDRAIVGFRQPEIKTNPGAKDNRVDDSCEVRIASHCIAVLGTKAPYEWTTPEAASFCAENIDGVWIARHE